MGVELSHQDVRRFRAASRALTSPLEYDALDRWGAAVNAALCDLFGAQRAALVLPRPTHVHFSLRGFDPGSVEPYQQAVSPAGPGTNRYADPLLDHAMGCLERAGVDAWTTELAEGLSGIPSERIPLFQEVLIPGGLSHMAIMGAAHDHGMALCGVYHEAPRADPLGAARLELIGLLAPSFQAGVHVLDRLEGVRHAVDALLDHVSDAILVCDTAGRELHRNRALKALLDRDPEGERVIEAMRRVARAVARLEPGPAPEAGTVAGAGRAAAARVRTTRHRYALHAGFIGAGVFGRGRAVVVSPRRAAPILPAPDTLMERCGLTRREAEVALRVARGHSNAEIAAELCRSPHTIRHHAEHIFQKLGIRTRKALALKLMEVRASAE